MILVAGEALFDVFVGAERGNALALEARPGGSPFNVALGLARLGQAVGFLGGLSEDFLGGRLMRLLQEEGVDAGFVQRRRQPTTLSIVGLDPDGSPAYAFYGDGADRALSAADLPELPERLRALHFGSFSTVVEPIGSALEALLRRESARRLISFDPNVRTTIEPDIEVWRRKFASFLPFVHLLKISEEDQQLLFPGADPGGLAKSWLAEGLRLVVLTRGAKGVRAWSSEWTIERPAVAVKIVDTVGAGDSYQAALLAGLSETGRLDPKSLGAVTGAALEGLLDFAGAAAAITCSRRGADMPRRAELPAIALAR
jgi:fructokinase